VINYSALPGRRGEPGIGRDLSPVVKVPGEPLGPENSGKFRPDTFQVEQQLRRWRDGLAAFAGAAEAGPERLLLCTWKT
jgi:hypothetical protein